MPRTKVKQYNEKQWYEDEKLTKLQKTWYGKLRKSGFRDAEEFDSPLELMKEHHNEHFRQKFDNDGFLDRQRYYELASQLVYEYPFESELDKKVWYHHSEGVPERKIAKLCRCSYTYVRKTVKTVKLAIKRDAKDILQDIDRMKKNDD